MLLICSVLIIYFAIIALVHLYPIAGSLKCKTIGGQLEDVSLNGKNQKGVGAK